MFLRYTISNENLNSNVWKRCIIWDHPLISHLVFHKWESFSESFSLPGLYPSKLLLDHEFTLGHLKFKISKKNWWSYPKPTHSVLSSLLLVIPFLYSLVCAPNPGTVVESFFSSTHIWFIPKSTHLLPLHHLLPGSLWGCFNLISCFLPCPLVLSE